MARLALWCAALTALLCTSTIVLAARAPGTERRSLKGVQENQATKLFPFLFAKHVLGGGLSVTVTKGGSDKNGGISTGSSNPSSTSTLQGGGGGGPGEHVQVDCLCTQQRDV